MSLRDEVVDLTLDTLLLPSSSIIPFVAADALDSKKETSADNLPAYPLVPERITESPIFSYTNLFSPPVETEGTCICKFLDKLPYECRLFSVRWICTEESPHFRWLLRKCIFDHSTGRKRSYTAILKWSEQCRS